MNWNVEKIDDLESQDFLLQHDELSRLAASSKGVIVATASSVIILASLQQILDMNHDAAHDLDSGIKLQ
jgi:hypothetical protein